MGLLSPLVVGSFGNHLMIPSVIPSIENVLNLRLDPEPGFFSILIGESELISRAYIVAETETARVTTFGGRFEVEEERASVLFRDRSNLFDLELRWRREEQGKLFAIHLLFHNRAQTEVRLKDLVLLTAPASADGGLAFWKRDIEGLVLTDEWERCYGEAGARRIGGEQRIQSAWDIHLVDPRQQIQCTLSYYAIPNCKLFFSLIPQPGEKRTGLIVRADTRAGSRGLLIEKGKSFALSELMIFFSEGSPLDALESYAALIAKRNSIAPPAIYPVGWVDWYFAKASTTEEDVMKNLDFIAQELKDFGLEYVQIDSGWQLGVETTPPPHNVIAGGPWIPNNKFHRGMRWFADQIKRRGLKPGIWVRPFQMIADAPERREHPEWFNENGQMDFSHPGVLEFLERLFIMLTDEWGYEYVKYDFPSFDLTNAWGPKLFEDRSAHAEPHRQDLTNIEAYRNALQRIAEVTKGKAHLLACNSLMAPTLGVADVFRIGDDVGDWARTFRYGVKSVSARYYTNGIFWVNDPDCLLVRDPFTLEQAQMWASLIALSGGVVFVSEYLERLPQDRLALLKKAMPVYANNGGNYRFGRPLDLFENNPAQRWLWHIKRPFGSWYVLGLFNWSEQPVQQTIRLRELGIHVQEGVHVYDFWNERYRGQEHERIELMLQPQSCVVFSLHEHRDRPFVLSTTRHITQGAVELSRVQWDERHRTLRGTARAIKNNPYDISIFCGDHRVETVDGSKRRESDREGIVRIRIEAESTLDRDWQVRFR